MRTVDRHKIFADHFLLTGDATAAYQKAYPKAAKESARVKSYSLLRRDTVRAYIDGIQSKINEQIEKKLVEKIANREITTFLTVFEKREILAKIARGEMNISINKPVWNGLSKSIDIQTVDDNGDHSTRMRAIDLDNKMSGDEAPKRSDITSKGQRIGGEIDYSKLSDAALEEIINAGAEEDKS